MIVSPIHPRNHARMNPAGVFVLSRLRHIRDQRGLHHISQRTNHGDAPRSVPVAIKLHLILVRTHTIILWFAIIEEGCSTLATFDVRLCEQHKHILCRLNQHREAPTSVVVLHDLGTTKAAHRLHLTSRRQREEALIAIAPLLYPAFHTLRNRVNRLFTFQLFVLQARQLIAERHTIVIETEYQQHRLSILVGILTHILIRNVAGMKPFALFHLVVSLDLATLHHSLKSESLTYR